MRVKCFAQEHNTITQPGLETSQPRVQHTNHWANTSLTFLQSALGKDCTCTPPPSANWGLGAYFR